MRESITQLLRVCPWYRRYELRRRLARLTGGFLLLLVLLVPGLAAAQDEAGGGGSGAGGSNNMDNIGGYVPADDPSCPREVSWDWFLYCSETESIPYYVAPHSGSDHSCDGRLKFALTVCGVWATWTGGAQTAIWCGAAATACAAGATWGFIEDAYYSYFNNRAYQSWFNDLGSGYAQYWFSF